MAKRRRISGSLVTRILGHTDRSSGCWIWTGHKDRDGYGSITVEKRHRIAHKVAYEEYVGPVPAGMELDHTCRNRACCNPLHLEPVTHLENVRRGAQTWQGTTCKRGHELTPENIRVHTNGTKRQCLVCFKASRRAAEQRRREALAAAYSAVLDRQSARHVAT